MSVICYGKLQVLNSVNGKATQSLVEVIFHELDLVATTAHNELLRLVKDFFTRQILCKLLLLVKCDG